MNPTLAALFVQVWDDAMLADEVASNLTCTELEALVDLIEDLGGRAHDDSPWIAAHRESDDEGDLHYQEET